MKKGLLITIMFIGIFLLSIFIGYYVSSIRNNTEKNYLSEEKLATNDLEDIVTTSKGEEVISPNMNTQNGEVVNNNIKYMLKEYNGCVAVYTINKNGEIVFEDTTDILTRYLSEEDLIELKKGIITVGLESLNKLLEDFEQ